MLKNINNLKKSETWKIHLTITINFISSEDDNDEQRIMHSKSDDIGIMINYKADEFVEKHFESLNRYQNNLERLMKGSKFAFDDVHLFYY